MIDGIPVGLELGAGPVPTKSESGGILVTSSFTMESLFSECSFRIIPFKLLPPTPFAEVSRAPDSTSALSTTTLESSTSEAFTPATVTLPPFTLVSSTAYYTTSSLESEVTALTPTSTERHTVALREVPPPPIAATALFIESAFVLIFLFC